MDTARTEAPPSSQNDPEWDQSVSVFDMPPDEAHEAALDAQAEAEFEAGLSVSHERVREWLQRLINGEEVPPPGPD